MYALEVEISPEMLVRAGKKAEAMGQIRNSILKGAGNLAGFLGEEMFLEAFPGAISENTFSHDILCEGKKVEVKTVQTTVKPKPDYHCHVAAYNNEQAADIYVFARVLKGFDKGWLMGWIDCSDWRTLARFAAKGEPDGNNWHFPVDCYNLRYCELNPFGKSYENVRKVNL